MKKQTVTVINKLGLHARAACQIVNLATSENANITLKNRTGTADAASLMELLMISGYKGTEVEIVVEDETEKRELELLGKVVELFEKRFGEKE